MKQFITLFVGLLAWGQTASAQGLLEQIEANNPQLKAAQHANLALMAETRSENTLGQTSVEYSPFYQSGVSGTSSSELIVSQEFDFPTLYAARSRSASTQQQLLDVQYLTLRRDILLQAQQRCFDYYTAQQAQQLLQSRLCAADSLLQAFDLRLRQGDATLIDLNRIKMDRMAVSAEVIRNEAQIRDYLLDLQQLNGGQPVSPADITAVATSATQSAEPLARALEVSQAEAALQDSRQKQRVAQQGWLPSLTMGYRRNTELREAQNGFLVGVSLPLFSNAGKVKAARQHRAAAELQVTAAQTEQQTRLESLQAQLQQLRQMLDTYDQPLMLQQLSLLHRAVMAGELSVIDYFNEADRIYSLLNDRLTIQNEYLRTSADLHRDAL